LEVCDRILSQHSKNAQFQALRLKVEQAQRQELSAYIAEVAELSTVNPIWIAALAFWKKLANGIPTKRN